MQAYTAHDRGLRSIFYDSTRDTSILAAFIALNPYGPLIPLSHTHPPGPLKTEKIQGAAQSPCGSYVAVMYYSNQLCRIPMENGLPGSQTVISLKKLKANNESELAAVAMPSSNTIYTLWTPDGVKLHFLKCVDGQASEQMDLRSEYEEKVSDG
jgi:hypothetical protein